MQAPALRVAFLPTVLGVLVTVGLLLALFAVSRVYGKPPGIPWVCDDTRFVDTVPAGRGVVGPSVSAPPGCGGLGR